MSRTSLRHPAEEKKTRPLIDTTTGNLIDWERRARAAIRQANDPVRLVVHCGNVCELVEGHYPQYRSAKQFQALVREMCECDWGKRWHRISVLDIIYSDVPECFLPVWNETRGL